MVLLNVKVKSAQNQPCRIDLTYLMPSDIFVFAVIKSENITSPDSLTHGNVLAVMLLSLYSERMKYSKDKFWNQMVHKWYKTNPISSHKFSKT